MDYNPIVKLQYGDVIKIQGCSCPVMVRDISDSEVLLWTQTSTGNFSTDSLAMKTTRRTIDRTFSRRITRDRVEVKNGNGLEYIYEVNYPRVFCRVVDMKKNLEGFGVAVCRVEDDFCETTGWLLSAARAENELYRKLIENNEKMIEEDLT